MSVCPRGGSLSGGISVWGGVFVWKVSVQGSSVQGGLCPGWGSVRENPPYGNERAVRILLECILVVKCGYINIRFLDPLVFVWFFFPMHLSTLLPKLLV